MSRARPAAPPTFDCSPPAVGVGVGLGLTLAGDSANRAACRRRLGAWRVLDVAWRRSRGSKAHARSSERAGSSERAVAHRRLERRGQRTCGTTHGRWRGRGAIALDHAPEDVGEGALGGRARGVARGGASSSCSRPHAAVYDERIAHTVHRKGDTPRSVWQSYQTLHVLDGSDKVHRRDTAHTSKPRRRECCAQRAEEVSVAPIALTKHRRRSRRRWRCHHTRSRRRTRRRPSQVGVGCQQLERCRRQSINDSRDRGGRCRVQWRTWW